MRVCFVVEHHDTEPRRWGEEEVDAHADLLRALPTIDGALVLEGTEPERREPVDEWDQWEEHTEAEKPEPVTFRDELWAAVTNLAWRAPAALQRDGQYEYRATSWASRVTLRREGDTIVLEGTHLPETRLPADELLPALWVAGERFLAFVERLYGPADGRVALLRAERDAATAALGGRPPGGARVDGETLAD